MLDSWVLSAARQEMQLKPLDVCIFVRMVEVCGETEKRPREPNTPS